jgi:hypothetical protein
MAETIKRGTVLIAEDILLPESLLLESEPYADGWRLVRNLDSRAMDQSVSKAGWNFFYMAGRLKESAFGSDGEKTTRQAIRRVIRNMKSRNFNCLEITQVAAKRFLTMPYVSVSAHWRHIQESRLLFENQDIA